MILRPSSPLTRLDPNDPAPSELADLRFLGCEDDTIVLYNCADVLDFKNGTVDLPVRLTCCCRHHSKKVGIGRPSIFGSITFILHDHTGRTVGTGTTSRLCARSGSIGRYPGWCGLDSAELGSNGTDCTQSQSHCRDQRKYAERFTEGIKIQGRTQTPNQAAPQEPGEWRRVGGRDQRGRHDSWSVEFSDPVEGILPTAPEPDAVHLWDVWDAKHVDGGCERHDDALAYSLGIFVPAEVAYSFESPYEAAFSGAGHVSCPVVESCSVAAPYEHPLSVAYDVPFSDSYHRPLARAFSYSRYLTQRHVKRLYGFVVGFCQRITGHKR
ncbi:unnamed protein product [Rhizoctonia solani]|uniref:SPT23/MGA2-like DNA-binding domain-containing protein n=1 Tax=Rhizoctonia solani TaxID=456999 RepID=A0A8H3HCE6_9AGAM|nr:unnamed protein product [Rhizoctonia solani]